MEPMKGLVIDAPWIDLILAGEKIWEMRSKATHERGRIALIRKGSGLVVGIADIDRSRPPIETLEAYAESEPFHRIPPQRQRDAFERGWRVPWYIPNARPLPRPVPYRHPNGAVTWVKLDPDVVEAIRAQSTDLPPIEELAEPVRASATARADPPRNPLGRGELGPARRSAGS